MLMIVGQCLKIVTGTNGPIGNVPIAEYVSFSGSLFRLFIVETRIKLRHLGGFEDQTNFGPNWITARTISLDAIQVIVLSTLLETTLMAIS